MFECVFQLLLLTCTQVRRLLAAITARIQRSLEIEEQKTISSSSSSSSSISPVTFSIAMYGLQKMSSVHSEVRSCMVAITRVLGLCTGAFTPVEIANSVYGTIHLHLKNINYTI